MLATQLDDQIDYVPDSPIEKDESTLEHREMRPLPKRARYSEPLILQKGSETSSHASSDEVTPNLSSAAASSISSVEGLSSDSIPPFNYYQPVFAPVASLVKQVAAATTLFGNLSLDGIDDIGDGDQYLDSPAISNKRMTFQDEDDLFDANDVHLVHGSNRKKRKVPAPMGSDHFPSSPPSLAVDRNRCTHDDALEDATFLPDDRSIGARADFGSDGHTQRHDLVQLVENTRERDRTDKDSSLPRQRLPYTASNKRSPQGKPKSKAIRTPLSPLSANGSDSPAAQSMQQPARKAARSRQTTEIDAAGDQSDEALDDSVDFAQLEPKIVLPNLWDPKLGTLVPRRPSSAEQQADLKSTQGQPNSDAEEPANLALRPPSGPFHFHVPLSQMLIRRLEELNREKERLQLARDVARERLRDLEQVKRKAEAELADAKRKSSGIHYVTGGMQTGADGGKEMFASRWSTVEPSQPLQRPPKNINKKLPSEKSEQPPPKKGKKKRSALANANNVHHRDNYVPSRQPRQAPPPLSEALPSLGLVGLENEFSTENYQAQLGYSHLIPFFAGPDEWICSYCEISLLFGDEAAFRRLMKKRKDLVKIRKRAQRRAARAASGQAPPATKKKSKPQTQPTAASTGRKNASTQTVQDKVDPHALSKAAETTPASSVH